MRKLGLAALLMASSALGTTIRPDQPVSALRYVAGSNRASAQTGGSIASNGTLSLVAWNESTGPGQAVIRAALIAADGELGSPIEIGNAHPQSLTATASNGSDFLVAWVDSQYHFVARRVTLAGVLDPSPITITPYGSPADAMAISWSGQVYVVVTAGLSAVTITGVTASGTVAVSRQVIDSPQSPEMPAVQCGNAGCNASWRRREPWNGASLFVPVENNHMVFTDAMGAVQAQALITDLVDVTPALPVAMADGTFLFVYSYGKAMFAGRITEGGLVLDAPAINGGVGILYSGTKFPLQPVAAVRSGLYLVELDDNTAGRLYWICFVTEPKPRTTSLVNLHESVTMPVTMTASSRNVYLLYTSGEDDPNVLAPRLFLRTIASPDPQNGTPRRRAAH